MLKQLESILKKENLIESKEGFESRYFSALQNKEIREILEIEKPIISNLTDILEIENGGELYAIRMDLNKGVDNHKKQIVAGLILKRIMQKRIPKKGIDTLIDGGNYNSAKALKYYVQKFGMKGIYIMSPLFLQKPSILKELESENFQIQIAPTIKDSPIEREFYNHLFKKMRNKTFNKNKICLWHAKYSGKAMYPLGKEIAKDFLEIPDHIVSCIGAGSTFEGIQLAMQDYYLENNLPSPSIIIGEHELSPLFAKFIKTTPSQGSPKNLEDIRNLINPNYYKGVKGLPHLIIGPHYHEINPLISKESISRINEIYQYSNEDCISMQKYLENHKISVGNSSAANISVATNIANQGKNVLTIIFEPFRNFYKK